MNDQKDITEQLRELSPQLCCVDRDLIDSARYEIERLRRQLGSDAFQEGTE